MTDRQSKGFTLVELLVSIGIIGILVGLTLPAVQRVREIARRVECSNHLRQLGIALHNHEAARKSFPASGWTTASSQNPSGAYIGWQAIVLPHLEQNQVLSAYDDSSHWWTDRNLIIGRTSVPVYQCPSTPLVERSGRLVAKPPRPALDLDHPLGGSDFAAIMGVRSSIAPQNYSGSQATRSVMFRNSATRFADITDGASNTVLVVECAGRPAVFRQAKRWLELASDQGNGWVDSEGGFSLDGSDATGTRLGQGPIQSPYAMNRTNENEPYSFHPGGAHFLFADGRCEFISESIALSIAASLITRAASD